MYSSINERNYSQVMADNEAQRQSPSHHGTKGLNYASSQRKSDNDRPLLTLIHCSDVHLAPDRQACLNNFALVADYVNAFKPDVMVITGDLVDGRKGLVRSEFQLFKDYINKVNTPVLYVPGNHDIGNKPGLGNSLSIERLSAYKEMLGSDRWYYEMNSVHLLGLNNVLLNSNFSEEREQREWLVRVLQDIPMEEKTLLFAHYPLFLENPEEALSDTHYWTVGLPAGEEQLYFLSQFKVTAYLCGHCHKAISREYAGTKFIAAPAVSFSLTNEAESVGINIVRIYPDELSVKTIRLVDLKS